MYDEYGFYRAQREYESMDDEEYRNRNRTRPDEDEYDLYDDYYEED